MNSQLFMRQNGLQTGDRLITEKGPFSRHHAIVARIPGRVPLVAENQAGKGVQYIMLENFLLRTGSGKIWIRKFTGTEMMRETVIPRIDALIGRPYNLVNFNCEHFANLIQTGAAVSQQVAVAVLGAVVIGSGVLAFGGNRR
jgi:hypothetical protein